MDKHLYYSFPGMLPLWAILFEKMLYVETPPLQIPFGHMTLVFVAMTTSLFAGHVLHRRFRRTLFRFRTYVPTVAMVTTALFLLYEVFAAYHVILSLPGPRALLPALLLVAGGYGSGALVAGLARQPPGRVLVIAVETGARTSHVVGHVLVTSLPEPEGDLAMAASTLCAVASLAPAVAMATVYRFVARQRTSAYDGTECKMVEGGILVDDLEALCPTVEVATAADETTRANKNAAK